MENSANKAAVEEVIFVDGNPSLTGFQALASKIVWPWVSTKDDDSLKRINMLKEMEQK